MATFPISDSDVARLNRELISHLPAQAPYDGLRLVLMVDAQERPKKALELLACYYAMEEDEREDVRAVFYAAEDDESWNKAEHGPTTGEYQEAGMKLEIPPLPENLVELCRERLKPMIDEHVVPREFNAEEFNAALKAMGIA